MRKLIRDTYHQRMYGQGTYHTTAHSCPCATEADFIIDLVGSHFDRIEKAMDAMLPLTAAVAEIEANGCRADRLMARDAMVRSVEILNGT